MRLAAACRATFLSNGSPGRSTTHPNNLFVTGGSGGGILTAWIVGKTDRFKAAAAQKPVINWASMALTSDGTPFFGRYWMGAEPWENYQSYWARSPLSLIANVRRRRPLSSAARIIGPPSARPNNSTPRSSSSRCRPCW
jgi:acetyl esterase/lipase